jgi:hypothetical protein
MRVFVQPQSILAAFNRLTVPITFVTTNSIGLLIDRSTWLSAARCITHQIFLFEINLE